jgi:hypothetical protein
MPQLRGNEPILGLNKQPIHVTICSAATCHLQTFPRRHDVSIDVFPVDY